MKHNFKTTGLAGLAIAVLILCAAALTSCNKEEGNKNALVGEWKSVSATGTVNYFNTTLTSIVNSKLDTMDLTGIANLEFDKEGKASCFPYIYTYTFEDNVLRLTPYQGGQTDLYKVEVNGNEFTLTHHGLFVGKVLADIAWEIGNKELKANGLSGSVNVTSANLVVKFQKVIK